MINHSNSAPMLKASFYWREMENGERVLFCRVRISQYSTWDQPVREQDKIEFATEWERFQMQEELRIAKEEAAAAKAEAEQARTRRRKPDQDEMSA